MKRRAQLREMQDGKVQNSVSVSPLFAANTVGSGVLQEALNSPERSESPDLSDARYPAHKATSGGVFSPPVDISRELILSPKEQLLDRALGKRNPAGLEILRVEIKRER